jgi:hypothetical protein
MRLVKLIRKLLGSQQVRAIPWIKFADANYFDRETFDGAGRLDSKSPTTCGKFAEAIARQKKGQ